MKINEIKTINNRLSRLTLITIAGDFISLFSFAFLFMSGGNGLLAGLVIPIKACACIISTLSFPRLINKIGARSLISISQLIPFFSSALIAILVFTKTETRIFIAIAFFVESFFSFCFQTTRSSFPKLITDLCKEEGVDSEVSEQLQASTEHAHQKGVFIGSLAFFIMTFFLKFPIAFLLIINAISFLIAFIISIRIPQIPIQSRLSLLGAINKIRAQPKLLIIFFIRTFGLWVPISLFNTSMYGVTTNQYSLSPSFFSLVGVCSAFGAIYVHKKYGSEGPNRLKEIGLADRGIIGSILYLLSMLILARLSNPLTGGFILILIGAANAFLINSSRSILSSSTSSSGNSEILNLDSFCGRIIDIIVSILYLNQATYFNLNPTTAFYLSAGWILLILLPAFYLLKNKLSKSKVLIE